MKIFVAGFGHETNTFVSSRARYDDFDGGAYGPIFVGDAIFSLRTQNLPIAGFIDVIGRTSNQVMPGIWAHATPSGFVTDDAYERIANEIVERARHARADAIYLDLHGAMVTERFDDGEGELLKRLRAVVGPRVIIVASLDLHANVTEQMFHHADALVPFRTYPHVDMAETGARAARVLLRIGSGGRREHRVFRRMPFLIPIEAMATSQAPASHLYALVARLEREYEVDLSVTLGFPSADICECGPAIWGDGVNRAELDDAIARLEQVFCADEENWQAAYLSADEAVLRAKEIARSAAGPVVIADTHDNPGAGAGSDTTEILEALLRHRVPRAAFGLLYDPAAAAAAHAAGVGASVDLTLAAHTARPLPVRCFVEALADGRCKLEGPMMRGTELRLGLCACLRVEDVRVVVTSMKTQLLDRNLYRMVGIEPERMAVLVNKSSVHFRAAFEPIAEEILIARTQAGIVTDPARLSWKKLDPAMRLSPGGNAGRAPGV
ncbi:MULTISPECIES: M81 family metallopeptidase [Burkholderia]|uniref:M81 family metallopeptidase n=1 Tax=Burkholderia TaxID=32008 RepID=UPI00084133DF|nr:MULTISPECIES: M81 family metallopeptidase [unclassified Burkholderia]AOK32409.1 microcystin degradation protein MlrC [Burkholderia sp. Bp7605]